eukprot:scaffold1377_cov92-Isochrysis_galbana.AAC.2
MLVGRGVWWRRVRVMARVTDAAGRACIWRAARGRVVGRRAVRHYDETQQPTHCTLTDDTGHMLLHTAQLTAAALIKKKTRMFRRVQGPEDPAPCAGPAQGCSLPSWSSVLRRSFASKSRMFNPKFCPFLFLAPVPPECKTLRSAGSKGPCAGPQGPAHDPAD